MRVRLTDIGDLSVRNSICRWILATCPDRKTWRADFDSESVEELAEEGQAREAAFVEGVESAPDPDQGEVRTREVPEDDVPGEYDED